VGQRVAMTTTGRLLRTTRPLVARLRARAAWITVCYAGFATLWIFASDRVLGLLVAEPGRLVQWSVYKGVAFVAVTSVLLLLLMQRAFGAVATGYAMLKAQEAEIQRRNRIQAALSHINQAIVRLPVRDDLFQRVCRVLVEHGGFRLAWIGWHDPASDRLATVAVAGRARCDVEGIRVHAEDRPQGGALERRAFREGRPFVCNDLLANRALAPWRHDAQGDGLRASVALPIRKGERVAGVLGVYADEPGFFQDEELALLTEAAADVTFALDNLEREEARRRAQERAASEQRFSNTMLESMPGVVYFYDSAGRFLRWNQNFEAISGYSGDEIARMHPRDFFPSEHRARLEARITEAFEHGESSIEAPFLSRDGRTTPYFFTGRRVAFEGLTCLVGVGIDISERTQTEEALRESLERFEVVALATNDAVWDWDLGTNLIWWNKSFQTLFGYRSEEIEPGIESWIGRLHPEDRERVEGSIHAVIDGHDQAWSAEYRFRRRDGSYAEIFDRGYVLRDREGRGVRMIGAMQDISVRKRAEAALRELNANLETKVTERTAALQTALVRAEAADRIKSAFLATMSHELRTPLNSIIGFTGIVLQGLSGPLTAEQTKQLGMVRGSARHLLDLINDVLDISKIEAGQLEVRATSFDLPELVERVVATVQPLADQKGLSLAARVGPSLGEMVSDPRRIEQMLLNLLNNAVKFTERGGVTLDVEALPDPCADPAGPARDAVRMRVADTGIGIAADDLEKLFQPFRQLDTGLTRQHEGTGLGLAICRRLAELLGGTISARSEWLRGSEFTVVLPLKRGAEA